MVLKAKNNPQTTPEQFQTNFQKAHKKGFLILKMVKVTLSEGQNLYKKFRFCEAFAQIFTLALGHFLKFPSGGVCVRGGVVRSARRMRRIPTESHYSTVH